MSTTRSRVREPAPADQAPGYSAVLVHGLVYHLVSGDGVPDGVFEHGKPTPVSERTAHHLAGAAVDLVTRGHATDAEGLYSVERQKFLVTDPAGAVITPDGIEPPAAREVARVSAVAETA